MEFTPTRRQPCGNYSSVCSDECFIAVKQRNARGDRTQTYNGMKFDSRWEIEIAKFLDGLGITWIRPGPIAWIDDAGKRHNYWPDFLLPDSELYLDPKNKWAIVSQREKLDVVSRQVQLVYGDVETIKKAILHRGPGGEAHACKA